MATTKFPNKKSKGFPPFQGRCINSRRFKDIFQGIQEAISNCSSNYGFSLLWKESLKNRDINQKILIHQTLIGSNVPASRNKVYKIYLLYTIFYLERSSSFGHVPYEDSSCSIRTLSTFTNSKTKTRICLNTQLMLFLHLLLASLLCV